jgi:deoxycytidine triphosphate deaminase
MSLLSADSIRRLARLGVDHRTTDGSYIHVPLIDPMSEERFNFIEGSHYDLTLKAVHRWEEQFSYIAEIGINERRTYQTQEIQPDKEYDPRKLNRMGWMLHPHTAYLLEAYEMIAMPQNLNGELITRTSAFRNFCAIICSDVAPNYYGPITVLALPFQFIWFQQGAHFISMKLEQFDTEITDGYEGIYGKEGFSVSTEGRIVRGH